MGDRKKATGIVETQIADGGQVKFITGKAESMAAGRAVTNNLIYEVAIAPKAQVGLLGHDFFSNYDVRILEELE